MNAPSTPPAKPARWQGVSLLAHGKVWAWISALVITTALTGSPAQAQSAAPAAPAAAGDKLNETKPAENKPADAKPADTKPDNAAKDTAKPETPKADAPKADAASDAIKDAAKDAFGEALNMSARNVVLAKATAKWDTAFDTIIKTIKSAQAALDYTSTDDAGFSFQAAIPVDDVPANLPKELTKGQSPAGKALKFIHRGSYDNMDNTYEAITNHLDEKKLEALDSFIEEYTTDPINTAEDKLIINVLVPLKE
jgi:effector-binding domain-containing protein